ncbi:hypothetical protein [Roseburia sp. OM04-10AA]|uniref:hypothetical protein n=1 Tax=Roseburia sp. OM04-10AA TaxID=2293141 RepID=UPI000E49EB7F|nr:hypothetical protein [Roseburia sp. OM04-10AA]RHV59790.1 hypothetical protein DXB42_04395 [Roseburia sp. OM04-10AA]
MALDCICNQYHFRSNDDSVNARSALLIVSLIAEVLIIVGAGLILFAQKKVGFYLMIACAAIGLVINIFGGVGVVKSIISAVLCPLITYLFMQKDWDSFR